jgi:hypothetical protein
VKGTTIVFTVQTMLGNKALVSGTDKAGNEGQTIVSTTQWNELQARANFSKATADFDAEVEKFFAPLEKAAKKVAKKTAPKPTDSVSYIVLQEGVDATAGQPAQIVELSQDSIILRLIEEGDTDRLVWVDYSTLGILAA